MLTTDKIIEIFCMVDNFCTKIHKKSKNIKCSQTMVANITIAPVWIYWCKFLPGTSETENFSYLYCAANSNKQQITKMVI
jgi:hypothetical protein